MAGCVLLVLVGWLGASAAAARGVAGPTPELVYETHHDVSGPLRKIAQQTAAEPNPTVTVVVPKLYPKGAPPRTPPAAQPDAGLQTVAPRRLDLGHAAFPGVSSAGYAPPDTNGAAGPTQYVQWVNVRYAVYDKQTGTRVFGPALGNSLWSGFGGPCETNNDGDAIAQFDKVAGRWVMAQPVFSSPFTYCVAVSTTSDATGSYRRYAFPIPGNYFPDYPKLSVWQDGYYVSFNAFDANGTTFKGALVCALNRQAMLAGTAAGAICFQNGPRVDSLLPSDLDGSTAPPAGSPNYFVHFVSNALNLYRFHVDWITPSNSTFTGPTTIAVNPFSEACGGGVCIPQGGTTQQLDSLGDRLMYRLAYRNFGDHESLVVNHSVAAGTSVGVRWYELRNTGPGFGVYQQGTFAPDASYRWMGSIAMDKVGNIAVGYSLSSSAMHPSIAYTVHVAGTDPLGTMRAETILVNGAGSQTGGLERWGDYSSMSVDPVDDCTFWYTTEYLPSNGSFNWTTAIASFAAPGCKVTSDFGLAASPGAQTVVQGQGTSYTVTVSPTNGFSGSVALSASGGPSGTTYGFSPNPSLSGSSTMTVSVPATATPGTYTVTITGSSGSLVHTAAVTLTVQGFSISVSPSSQTVAIGSSTTYTVTVTASGTLASAVGLAASGLPTGATASFNPASVNGSGSSTLTISTASTVAAGTYTVTVTGTSGGLSRSASATLVALAPSADVAITTTASPTSVTLGSNVTFTLGVVNNGPTGASGVVVTDALPAGLSFVSVSTSQGTCTGTTTVTCSVGALAKNALAQIKIVARTTATGSIRNTASVRANEPDPNTANNSSSATITVSQVGTADVALTMSGSGASVPVNSSYTYSLTVRNAGPNPATGVVITDPVPAGMRWTFVQWTQGTCVASTSSLITCTVTTLASGASMQVTIRVQTLIRATVTNTATVRANESDPNLANNSASVTTTIK